MTRYSHTLPPVEAEMRLLSTPSDLARPNPNWQARCVTLLRRELREVVEQYDSWIILLGSPPWHVGQRTLMQIKEQGAPRDQVLRALIQVLLEAPPHMISEGPEACEDVITAFYQIYGRASQPSIMEGRLVEIYEDLKGRQPSWLGRAGDIPAGLQETRGLIWKRRVLPSTGLWAEPPGLLPYLQSRMSMASEALVSKGGARVVPLDIPCRGYSLPGRVRWLTKRDTYLGNLLRPFEASVQEWLSRASVGGSLEARELGSLLDWARAYCDDMVGDTTERWWSRFFADMVPELTSAMPAAGSRANTSAKLKSDIGHYLRLWFYSRPVMRQAWGLSHCLEAEARRLPAFSYGRDLDVSEQAWLGFRQECPTFEVGLARWNTWLDEVVREMAAWDNNPVPSLIWQQLEELMLRCVGLLGDQSGTDALLPAAIHLLSYPLPTGLAARVFYASHGLSTAEQRGKAGYVVVFWQSVLDYGALSLESCEPGV